LKPSDELFQLVKSMSGKEKLFFRKKYLQLTDDADSNYLKLFNEISVQTDKEKIYDESKIKSGKYSGKFLKNLSFHKNYLYNLILNSLSHNNRDQSDVFLIRNLMTQAEILSKRMLYDQSQKLLQKAKRLSSEKDLFSIKYEILNKERHLIKQTATMEEFSAQNDILFSEQYRIVELLMNSLDFYKLNFTVGTFLMSFGSGRVRGKDSLKEFEEMFDSPLLNDIEHAKTFLTKYIFHNIKLQYHLTKEEYKDAHKHAHAAVELCECNMDKLLTAMDNYVFALSNLLNCQIRLKLFNEFDSTAEVMKKLPKIYPESISEYNKVFIFYSLSVYKLSKNMEHFDIEALKIQDEEIQSELPLYEERITKYQKIILYFFLSASHFVREDFANCIHWNSKMFNLEKSDLSEDYQCYARIIQLIAYFELGYHDSLEYVLKSVYHFISRKKKVYKYENIIQRYLRRTFRIKTDAELMDMFEEMKLEIEKLLDDPFERNALDAFNILYWLESKIRKVSMVEVMTAKKNP